MSLHKVSENEVRNFDLFVAGLCNEGDAESEQHPFTAHLIPVLLTGSLSFDLRGEVERERVRNR